MATMTGGWTIDGKEIGRDIIRIIFSAAAFLRSLFHYEKTRIEITM